jgi:plastocyanin
VRRHGSLLLGCALSVAVASPAAGAEVTIGTNETDAVHPVWSPATVTIAPGDSVQWKLTSAASPPLPHNVASTTMAGTDSWNFAADYPAPEGRQTFSTPGRYQFYCTFHSDGSTGMAGTIVVGNPPPPPPPPLSEQPFPNDGGVLGALEIGGLDRTQPRLRSVRVQRMRSGARIRFSVSERARVTVRFKRGGKIVKTRHLDASGRAGLTVRGKQLRAGRYRVELRAEDLAGNRSGVRTARLTVR